MTPQRDDPELRGSARLAPRRVAAVRLNRGVLYLAREGAQREGGKGRGFTAVREGIDLTATLRGWQRAGDARDDREPQAGVGMASGHDAGTDSPVMGA